MKSLKVNLKMLILNRKKGQVLCIGDDVEILISDIVVNADRSVTVKIGIDAPEDVCVDRKEVRVRRIAKVDRVLKHADNSDGTND